MRWNFIKKKTLAQVFSCEFGEISKNTFVTEHLWWLLLLVILENIENLSVITYELIYLYDEVALKKDLENTSW